MNHRCQKPVFGPSSSLRAESLVLERQRVLREHIERGFPYSRKLSVHNSCVNSLAFSNRDARWLASAGDDPYILLWDLHQDNLIAPSHTLRGPRANVFSLGFSASNQYLYSGDTNETILKYDLSRLSTVSAGPGLPENAYHDHSDSVRAISCHPELDDVFLSAGEDGKVILHDSRTGSTITRAQGTLQHTAEFTSLQYHPILPNLFVTGDSKGAVCLRDVRMAFGPSQRRRDLGIVQTYITALSKPKHGYLARPEVGSVTFDKIGSKLAVTFPGYFPTIYALNDAAPLGICNGLNGPDGTHVPVGERTYSNACTIKHGSFGGPGLGSDDYYSAGSDDFRAYVWKIPDIFYLKELRQTFSIGSWEEQPGDQIAFATNTQAERYVPTQISTPLFRLTGHKSIVNSTLMHPYYPYILTAGVERHIILHSATPSSICGADWQETPGDVRELPQPNLTDRRRLLNALMVEAGTEDMDDADTIALFDEILRNESDIDVFESRRWDGDTDEDDSDEPSNSQLDTDASYSD